MKMRKYLCLAAIVLVALTATSFATTVQSVSIVQTTGVTGSYDAGTQILKWSAGASGMVSTDVDDYSDWTSATLTATFSGVTGLSTNAASFTNGTWDFKMSKVLGNFSATFEIWGDLVSPYGESLTPPNQLAGSALANVQGITWSNPTYQGWDMGVTDVVWANPNNLGSLTAGSLFTNFPGYLNNWQSTNITGAITSDVPEPATMSLLAIGALGLLKRKK
jgi:hypothetical protein